MTCIVAIKRADGGVTMAADRCITDDDDDTRQIMAEPKIFELGDLLIGAAGSCRPGQVIQYEVNKHHAKLAAADEPLRFIRTVFVPALADALTEHGCRWSAGSDHGEDDFSLLIVCRGRIFHLTQRLSVDEYREPFAAVGSGRLLALGALAVYFKTVTPVDQDLATKLASATLCIASQFDPAVAGPFDVFHHWPTSENTKSAPANEAA